LDEFPQNVFLWVDMESQLVDEEVWSPRLELGVKLAITLDPTVGLRSKFAPVSRGCFP
jgi:hypothetical protein